MDMPTPCAECEKWCEFDYMQVIGNKLYCDDCFHELMEGEE